MIWDTVEKIANAVLYEGYVLYPYRASAVKNQQRFNFGVLYPPVYCEFQADCEAKEMRTEVLIEAPPLAMVEVKTRFLQMIERDGWQEGVERDVSIPAAAFDSLIRKPQVTRFGFDGAINGEAVLSAISVADRAFRLSLVIRNLADVEDAGLSREAALLRSMVSVHSILHSKDGQFVSAFDPPERLREAAANCNNQGGWPVLAGEEGCRDLMLASPIILYDYPQVAPESAGDLCDGTEIDEILALRILTLTEEEKAEVRAGDSRAKEILERTETLPAEHFQKLHGAIRVLRPASTEASQ
jgi:hydrogenase maturation protease